MEYKKNDVYSLTITDANMDGDGVGKLDGFPIFVKDTVIGDVAEVKLIKVKKNYGYGRLMKLIQPSKNRVEPRCDVARQCGGCQLQFYSYQEQLRFKENKVKNHLERIGKVTGYQFHPIIGMEEPFHYRNKAQFPIGRNKDGRVIVGFYAGRTHSIIEYKDCVLGSKENKPILEIILKFMEEYQITPYQETTHTGLVRHILIRQGYHTGEIMVCMVINGTMLPHAKELVKRLQVLEHITSIMVNCNQEKTNVILGKELITLWGNDFITDFIGDICFRISPLSFFQVNPIQTEQLYQKALQYANLSGKEMVWDLYCGIGTISLFLAQKAKKVYGVEIVEQAIENAKENAKRNQIENVEFFTGKAEEVFPAWYRQNREQADVVVLDPPRKGCEEVLLQTIAEMKVERIVYISCDSATLARDVGILDGMGYRLLEVTPVDMFAQTVHVESIVLLSKLKSNKLKHINVELEMDELDLTAAESKATYEEIKDYILKQSGLKVSNLYIAQVKQKCGIIERANYNLPKSENSRQPKCPPEKEMAIRKALEHFGMI